MTSATGAEFDAFLYAPIGEERDGEPLTVLSTLARHDVDPWDEAARLARLPREAATVSLATVIAERVRSSGMQLDVGAAAARLIALLPRRVNDYPVPNTADHRTSMVQNALSIRRYLLFYVALMAFTLLSQWLSAPPQPAFRAASTTTVVVPHAAGPVIK